MSVLRACSYDLVVGSMERSCLRAWRSTMLADVQGRVLELGAGTGQNLDCYPATVEALTLVEPDSHMRHRLEKKLAQHELRHRCKLSGESAESLAADTASYDAVVSTLVLCSVVEVSTVLAEVRRVLRPGGRLLLIEHVAATEGSPRRKLQRFVEPMWKRVAGGCHLQRDPRSHLERVGFAAHQVQDLEIRGVPGFIKSGLMGTWIVA